ncbi:MAG: TonB-dependent receptor [Verrucomicrobiales bacterium]|nr:TonB-dependent receptor [Verrucomicrobiales bacterium]
MKHLHSVAFAILLPATILKITGAETNVYQLSPVTVQGAVTETIPQVATSAASTISSNTFRAGQIVTTRDLTAKVPNLTVFDANNDRSPKFSIRGLRENNFGIGEPVVGMYVDDVPYFDLNSRGISLFDIERVDFVRGSQGTLFGASGPGGVLNIVTRQPDNAWHGHAGMSYGNYDSQIYEAGISAPILTNRLYLTLSGLYSRRDGFVHNNALDTDPDTREALSGRASLKWLATEELTFTFTATGEQFRDGFVPTYYPTLDKSPFSVSRNFDGFVDTDSDNQSFKIAYDSSAVRITAVTSHRDWKQNLAQDFDFSASPFVSTIGFSNPELEQWSQELRVQSPEDADKLKWLGGLFFLHGDQKNSSGSSTFIAVPFPFTINATTKSHTEAHTYAAFGQATYTVVENLDLTAGVRLTYDKREMDRSRVVTFPPATFASSLEDDFMAAQPKVGISYHLTPKAEVYASVTEGYQSGGFNPSVDKPSQAKFNSASSWQFEVGAKSSCLEDKLSTKAALFYTETEDYHVFRLNPLNPTQSFLLNAERATSYGAELELMAKPVESLELNVGLSYTHATYDVFGDPNTGARFDGNNISFVPEYTANASATYRLPCNFYIRGELNGFGRYYLDDANTTPQPLFVLANAQIGYEMKNIEIYFFAKNIFDKRYSANALDLRNAFQPDLLVRQPGDPVTFGFAFNAHF